MGNLFVVKVFLARNLQVSLLHRCFSRFVYCANAIKSHEEPHMKNTTRTTSQR